MEAKDNIGIDFSTSSVILGYEKLGEEGVVRTTTYPNCWYIGKAGNICFSDNDMRLIMQDRDSNITDYVCAAGRDYLDPVCQEIQKIYGSRVVSIASKFMYKCASVPEFLFPSEKLIIDTMRDIVNRTKISNPVLVIPACYTSNQSSLIQKCIVEATHEELHTITTHMAIAACAANQLKSKKTVCYLVIDIGLSHFTTAIVLGCENVLECASVLSSPFLTTRHIAMEYLDAVTSKLNSAGFPAKNQDGIPLDVYINFKKMVKAFSKQETMDIVTQTGGRYTCTRKSFEEATSGIINAMAKQLDETMSKATTEYKIPKKMKIVLTGGFSRSPRVKKMVEGCLLKYGRREGEFLKVKKKEAAAIGASLISKEIQAETLDIRDCSPKVVGVITYEGYKHVLIQRGDPLPATATLKLQTTQNRQPYFEFAVWEGDEVLSIDNRINAIYRYAPIEEYPKGAVTIALEVTLQEDMTLDIKVKKSISQKIVDKGIKNGKGKRAKRKHDDSDDDYRNTDYSKVKKARSRLCKQPCSGYSAGLYSAMVIPRQLIHMDETQQLNTARRKERAQKIKERKRKEKKIAEEALNEADDAVVESKACLLI